MKPGSTIVALGLLLHGILLYGLPASGGEGNGAPVLRISDYGSRPASSSAGWAPRMQREGDGLLLVTVCHENGHQEPPLSLWNFLIKGVEKSGQVMWLPCLSINSWDGVTPTSGEYGGLTLRMNRHFWANTSPGLHRLIFFVPDGVVPRELWHFGQRLVSLGSLDGAEAK